MTHSMTGVLAPYLIEYGHRSVYRIDDEAKIECIECKSNEHRIDYGRYRIDRAVIECKIEYIGHSMHAGPAMTGPVIACHRIRHSVIDPSSIKRSVPTVLPPGPRSSARPGRMRHLHCGQAYVCTCTGTIPLFLTNFAAVSA